MAFGLTSDDAIRIAVEVVTGKAPKRPDTDAMAAYRVAVQADVAKAKAAELVVEIPYEIPDVS